MIELCVVCNHTVLLYLLDEWASTPMVVTRYNADEWSVYYSSVDSTLALVLEVDFADGCKIIDFYNNR